jgi:tetratricopeptide (TPR) repeat protein
MTVVREAAQAYLEAKAKSRYRDALRRGDEQTMRAAVEDGDWAKEATNPPVEAADRLVREGNSLFTTGRQSIGAERHNRFLQADSKYRLALKLYPRMATASENHDLLNSVGYYLADQGRSQEDFQTAERLLRRSLQLWNEDLAQPGTGDMNRSDLRRRRALEPVDSLAWALYRLGRFTEAKKLSEEAFNTLRSIVGENNVDAAISYHLAEIHRALGETEAARRMYVLALRNGADAETEERIASGLRAVMNGGAPRTGLSPAAASTPPSFHASIHH